MATAEPSSVTNELSFLWLEVTARCNLPCSHCYAGSGPRADLHGNMAHGDRGDGVRS